jgi:ABC-type uncharacterized transport system permease subunit
MCAAIVGAFVTLPPVLHVLAAFVAGALGGALWGAIPGWLRARTGAHEVITTIMFNYIAIRGTDYLIKVPFLDQESSSQRTPYIATTAEIPFLFGEAYRLHGGFIIAVIATSQWRGCCNAPSSVLKYAPQVPTRMQHIMQA